MKLKRNERCPIHGTYWCCGREQNQMERRRKNQSVRGVTRIDDPHHPRGYREKRSRAAMAELLKLKVREQGGKCFYCGNEFDDFRSVTPDHREPRGLGGARRDDHPSNIVASCWDCNREKGSKRIPA